MKGSREEKQYIAKYRDRLKSANFDDLTIILKFPNCKKWYKRKKAMRRKELRDDVD